MTISQFYCISFPHNVSRVKIRTPEIPGTSLHYFFGKKARGALSAAISGAKPRDTNKQHGFFTQVQAIRSCKTLGPTCLIWITCVVQDYSSWARWHREGVPGAIFSSLLSSPIMSSLPSYNQRTWRRHHTSPPWLES